MQYYTFNTYENIQDNNLLENIIDKYECYICYEKLELNKDLFIKNNKLLKLNYCNCTELHIHKKCLLKWIDTKKEQNDQKYRYCEICNNLYKINKKENLFIDIIITIGYILFSILLIGFLVNLYKSENTYNSKIIASFFLSFLLILIQINLGLKILKIINKIKIRKLLYLELLDNVR
jgi:hypothetical protein